MKRLLCRLGLWRWRWLPEAQPMRAMKEVFPGFGEETGRLTNGYGYRVDDGQKANRGHRYYPPVPFFGLAGGGCVIRWKLSWRDRIHLAFTGNIWHVAMIADYGLQPIKLYARCPFALAPRPEPKTTIDVRHANISSKVVALPTDAKKL